MKYFWQQNTFPHLRTLLPSLSNRITFEELENNCFINFLIYKINIKYKPIIS